MKVFVDNVAAQAIETCLLARLTEILSPTSILEMPADLVTAIAGEPEECQVEREQLTRKLTVLKSGLEICKRYASRPIRKRAHEAAFSPEVREDEKLPPPKRTSNLNGKAAQPLTPATNSTPSTNGQIPPAEQTLDTKTPAAQLATPARMSNLFHPGNQISPSGTFSFNPGFPLPTSATKPTNTSPFGQPAKQSPTFQPTNNISRK